MIKKLISHECPVSMLDNSSSFNDYDYALAHLLLAHTEYSNYYVDAVKRGRTVILDNSVAELGEPVDADVFVELVQELKPTYYIIPDELDDSAQTIQNISDWMNKYPDLDSKSIGVVQGRTYEEMKLCYTVLKNTVDLIAFSFNCAYYDTFNFGNKYLNWMNGRLYLLNRLIKEGAIDYNKPHHLLGCNLPQEFTYYRSDKFDFIKSIDTAHPIIHGILMMEYNQFGLMDRKKAPIKIADLIDYEVKDKQIVVIQRNIELFSSFVNG